MPRTVTSNILARKFLLQEPHHQSNSTVVNIETNTYLVVCGQPIAKRDKRGHLQICDGGHPTPTTQSRLNAVIPYFHNEDPIKIVRRQGRLNIEWYGHPGSELPKEYRLNPFGREWVYLDTIINGFLRRLAGIKP